MTVLFNSFESPASGTTLTNANASNADGSSDFTSVSIGAGGTLQASNTHAAHGSQSLKAATGGTAAQTYAWWQASPAPFTGALGTVWGRIYCYFTANPGSAFPVVQLLDSGSNFGGRITINSSGKVVFNFGGSNSVSTTSTAAIPLNTWFRLEFKLVCSTTVGQTEVKIFTTSPDATSPDETNTSSANLNTTITGVQGARVGVCAATASLGPAWLDDVAFSDTGYIGPVVMAFTGTGAVTETATIAGSGSATGTGSAAEAASIAGAGGGTGAATVTVTAAIAGAGGAQGAGSVAETATIAGSGSANYTKTGSQTVTASIAGAGGGTGSGSVTVAAAIAGAGRVSASGAVTVTAAIAGSGQASGTGAVTETVTIAGSGRPSGSGAQTVTATIAGSGRPSGTGAAAVAVAIAGSGTVGFVGTGAVTVTATIAGSNASAITGTGAVNVAATIAGNWYFYNDAEEGTAGTPVGAGASGGSGFTADGSLKLLAVGGTGTLKLDNTQVARGSLSFKHTLDASGNDRTGGWSNGQVGTAITARMSKLLYLPSLPGSTLTIGYTSSASVQALAVQITTAGKLQVLGASGTTPTVSTSTVPVGSWFRVEWAILVASATVGQVEARLFTNPFGTTPTETVTSPATINTTAGTLGTASFGASALTGPASYSYWDDDYRLAPSAYPPAPASPASTGSGNAAVTAAIAGSGVLGYVGTGSATVTAAIAGTGFAPGSSTGSLTTTATIAGSGVVSDGGNLTVAATIAGAGRTTSTGAVSAVANITGTGALAVSYAPRTATTGAGNSRIITATLPSDTSAGDLLLCHLTVAQGGTAFTQPTISTPSGWTLLPLIAGANPLVSQGTNAGIVGAWYYRWATGTDTAPSWTLDTGSVLFKYSWTIEGYSGGPGSGAPRLLSGAGATGGAAVTTNTTATTTLAPASWYAETYSERSTTNTAYANPSGRTRRAAVFGSGGAAADMLWVDSNLSAAGTVGGDTATDDGTGSSWQIHGLIVFPALTGASVPVQATITGSGSVNSPNTASLAVTALISGTGVVSGFNPGLFVPSVVKPRYTLQMVDAPHLGSSSAVIGDLQMASGKSLTFNTPDASTLTWTMPGAHPESVLVGGAGLPGLWEMCTDAIIWRDIGPGPTKLARLRVVSGVDSSADSGDSVSVAWTASDYKAVFASRQIIEGDKGTVSSGGLSFPASTDVASIAWDLVNAAQAKTNGNMGIAKSLDGWSGGGVANTGKTFGAPFIVTPGTDLKSALDTLLAGDTSTPSGAAGGFDWWIDQELELHIKARNQVSPNPPGRGTASLFVADYHGTVRSFSRTPVIDGYANQVRADGGVTPSVHTSPTLATDPYGRVERNITVTINTTQTPAQQDALVSQVGAEALYVGNLPAASYTLVLTPGVWDPALLGVGDNVQVVIQAGRLNVNTLQRVLALQVEFSDDGEEKVTLTTARPDVANWVADQLAKLGARIKGLELRI